MPEHNGQHPVATAPLAHSWPQMLTEEEISFVYMAIVGHPSPSREQLLESGIDAHLVDQASRMLHARGLLVIAADGTWEVPAPDIALPAWAADTERRARAWRATASELHQVYSAARQAKALNSENRDIGTLADIASATATITAGATKEILCIRAASRRTEQLLLDPYNSHREIFRNAAGHPINVQAIYDPAILDTSGTLEALRERIIGGEEVRLTGPIHFSAIIVDEMAAVIEFSNIDPSGSGALLVRSRPFVTALVRIMRTLWALAVPLSSEAAAPLPSTAASRDAIILKLLAGGATDSTITRRLGISQRTVERRVRHLMDSLGAETRFQAGVEAARQGLV
ncbi:putative transcriptional regulatory protein [Nostocoides australiense Ben110]|uniref:Putative transcriptional regulatory protein n=1 Tax=Nostocoides australiense Ben110 TaxID=1193182 RepID=W6JV90_9MICO|nr:helix-turn-helix transcriptional regulator [Tetrasphaera australiensis]CCH72556.1 putative transcriptional regulatory protein [Tetrasphaera australiensis Ben110]